MKKLLIIFLLIASILFISPAKEVEGLTTVPYLTYTEDANGNLILTQDAYIPVGRISDPNFTNIREMQIFNDKIFVLNQENPQSSIIVFDSSYQFEVKVDLPANIVKPEGFYISNENLYIADLGVDDIGYLYVYEIDFDTYEITFKNKFGKPETPLFGENTKFLPKKIAVDSRGNLYVISEGALNGVLQMSETGRFFGFFGANKSDTSGIRNAFRTIFPTQTQLTLPPTPTNVAIDHEGFIFTVTEGLDRSGLKKFNVASRNFLPSQLNVIQGNIDLATGNFNNVYTLSKTGIIREYDVEGNMLFSFGGSLIGDTRLGLFQNPIAIQVTSENQILVADQQANSIQIFDYTEFASYVHLAIQNYQDVNFEEGIKLWNDVLLYNSWFDLAYKGIGNAYMSQGSFREAMEAYQKTNYIAGYSEAFWELRNTYIETYVGIIVVLFFGLQILYLAKRSYNKKGHKILPQKWHEEYQKLKETQKFKNLVHPLKIIKHPLDSFYDIKRGNNTSYIVSTFIYVMIGVTYFFQLLTSNYIFIGSIQDKNILLDLVILYGGIFIFIIMNYLVCSIREGSGHFKEVYIGVSYSILPIMIITIFMSLISNFLTLNEIFIYSYIHQIGFVWSGILLYFMVKDIHYYDVGETILNIIITMFAMIVVIFVGFMGYVVFNQSFNFFQEIIKEAIIRVQG